LYLSQGLFFGRQVRKFRQKNAGYNLLSKYGDFKVFFLLMWRKWAISPPPKKAFVRVVARAYFFLVARLRNLAQKENPLTGTVKKAQGREAHEPAEPG
jgi:hypothetical protein